MDVLWLSQTQLQIMIDHAQSEQPREACGLILGRGSSVYQILPTPNIAQDPQVRYAIDHAIIARYIEEIIGFYHSHPAEPAIPSAVDIREAWQGDTVYLIISLHRGSPKVTAWQFSHSRVTSVEIRIGEAEVIPHNLAQSITERSVILGSSLIAVLLLIVIALYLLPAAPLIP